MDNKDTAHKWTSKHLILLERVSNEAQLLSCTPPYS